MNKELEAFCWAVSHDLRAPLRSIEGFSRALLEDPGERLDEEGKDFLERVSAAAVRLARLIDDLLSLSRVTRGEIRPSTVDLTALAQEIAADLSNRQPDRQVEFLIMPGLAVSADAALFRIAMVNLLANAWKFTSKQPGTTVLPTERATEGAAGELPNQGTCYLDAERGNGLRIMPFGAHAAS
ncbi:MAG: histidine kinase, partial [Acidobacteria bacterium]|nr:histidine kinase [Acidobacteriota bacterium]